MSILAVQSSIGAADCDTHVIYSVCCVFCSIFYFLFVFHFLEFINNILVITYQKINMRHDIHNNIQFEYIFVDQLMYVLLMVMVLNMVHYTVSCLQVHTQVAISRTFFMFVTQCEYLLMCVLKGMELPIGILIKIPLFTSFLDVLTIMFYAIELSIVEIKEIKCVNENGSEKPMPDRSFRENFRNTGYNSHDDNVIDSMIVGIEGNDAMTYDLQQMHSIVLTSLYVVRYVIVHGEVENENELEFKFENENETVDCGKLIFVDFNYCF